MTKTVKKIKEVIKLNKPMFNEKYKVWVVRMKTNSGWKAVWRKQKEESQKVFDHLSTKIIKNDNPKVKIEDATVFTEALKRVDSTDDKTKPTNSIAASVLKKVFTASEIKK